MSQPLLQMQGLIKRFPGVMAINNVDFDLYPGEVHCLLGENGAGKSTLIRMLSGAQPMDAGSIKIDGREVTIANSADAKKLGISTIYQEINLVPTLTVLENLFLGEEIVSQGIIDYRLMLKQAQKQFASMNLDVNPKTVVRNLSVAKQQMVEVAKTLMNKHRIIIMDEPTAAISGRETDDLFKIIHKLKKDGVGIIYISHRLQELREIADRITVLRDGKLIGTKNFADTDTAEIIHMMVGRSLDRERGPTPLTAGKEAARLSGINWAGKLKNVDLAIYRGEVLGIAGLVGAGRTELMQILFGAARPDSGEITVKGRKVVNHSPVKAVKLGMSFLSEDRKREGLVLGMSVEHNMTLAALAKFTNHGKLDLQREAGTVRKMTAKLRIATSSIKKQVRFLSGGNQQKVVLGKWLLNDSDIIIFDEPTRGIDVGAKAEIYELMSGLAKQGKAVVMVSSELPEIIRMSNRIAVMSDGVKTGELANDGSVSQETLMELMLKGFAK